MKTYKELFGEILSTIEDTTRGKGYRLIENVETRLYGQVIGRGNDFWLHEVYAPLGKDAIDQLEYDVGLKLPKVLRDFYACANGLNLYSDELAIFGKRNTYNRSDFDMRLPYSIVSPNTEERPPNSTDSSIYIGSYSYDGSLVFIDNKNETISLCNSENAKDVIYKWKDIWTFLSNEVKRIRTFYNEQMVIIDDSATTLPPNEFKK
jgi:hypothetical protein